LPELAPGTSRVTLAVALATVYVVWGSVFLGVRLVVDEVDAFQAMAQRFLAAGLILVAVLAVRGGRRRLRVTWSQVRALVVTGTLLLGFGNGFMALGQVKGLPSGVAALVVACVPAWVVVIRLLTGDRPSRLTLAGVALGFLGLLVLVVLGGGAGGSVPLVGVLLVLLSTVSWSWGLYLQGRLDLPDDLFVVTAYQLLVAGACSATLALLRREQVSLDYTAQGWAALAYLVVACSIAGFMAFAWLLAHVPLSLTATHAYVNPVVAVVLGSLLLGEPLGVAVTVGGGLVLVAVVVVVTAEAVGARRLRAGPTTATPDLV
jgi:drug/metabolite transporter (DMT)-like permease